MSKNIFENYLYSGTYPRSRCGGKIAALLQAYGLCLGSYGRQTISCPDIFIYLKLKHLLLLLCYSKVIKFIKMLSANLKHNNE